MQSPLVKKGNAKLNFSFLTRMADMFFKRFMLFLRLSLFIFNLIAKSFRENENGLLCPKIDIISLIYSYPITNLELNSLYSTISLSK